MSTASTSRKPSPPPNGLPSPPSSPKILLDDLEPSNPYTSGATFVLTSHQPPKPFGLNYSDFGERDASNAYSKLDWCLSHLPSPGLIHHETTCSMTIRETIRVGHDVGAQIVLTDDGRVGKTYDPLFYRFLISGDDLDKDVAIRADSDYSIEAAAYTELHETKFEGNITPTYYGSWTFHAPVKEKGEGTSRQIRMILMEYIEGTCMMDLHAESLIHQARNNILVKVVEAETDLDFAGVRHEDLAPRNVLICGQNLEAPDIRVCLIDFNDSTVYKINPEWRPDPKYRSPILRWRYYTAPFRYEGWFGDREIDRDESIEWIWRQWGDSMKYERIHRDPTDPRFLLFLDDVEDDKQDAQEGDGAKEM